MDLIMKVFDAFLWGIGATLGYSLTVFLLSKIH
jgi:hypothetical protein